jgi:steroid delta-isomerase
MADRNVSPGLHRFIAYFESLRPEDVRAIAQWYADDAHFRDPFSDVRGTQAIEAVFARMFTQLDAPRFRIRDVIEGDRQAFLTWDFEFRFRRGDRATTQRIHGATLLRFDAAGRIREHRDYWDAAGELYEKLPFVGALLRWLRRRVGH